MSGHVAQCFEHATSLMSSAGAAVTHVSLPELEDVPGQFSRGGITAAEAYAWHQPLISERASEYDPRVSKRILRGRDMDATHYLHLVEARRRLIDATAAVTAAFDVLVMPTVPVTAPALDELQDDAEYERFNLLALRTPMVVNLLDRCAI